MNNFLSRKEETQLVDLVTELLQQPDNWIVESSYLRLKPELYNLRMNESSVDKAMMQQYSLTPAGFQIKRGLGMAWIEYPNVDLRFSAFWRLSKAVRSFFRQLRQTEYQHAGKSALWNLTRAKTRVDNPPPEEIWSPTQASKHPLLRGTSLIHKAELTSNTNDPYSF